MIIRRSAKMRDWRKPREYWDEMDEKLAKTRSTKIARKIYEELVEKKGSRFSPVGLFYREAVFNNLRSINYFYSRGDELDGLRANVLDVALENALFVQDVYVSDGPKDKNLLFFETVSHPGDLQSIYTMLTWCVCLDADVRIMRRLAPTIAGTGDRLVDTVLSRYETKREVAPGSASPKVFGLLDKVIDLDPDARAALMIEYLDSWGKRMSKLKGLRSLGSAENAMGAKSNADLEKAEFQGPGYVGWWAWEVALIVRVLGIDDSSFADHVLYPVDLARYRCRESPVDLWPIERAGTTNETAESVIAAENHTPIDDLIVAVDLPADTASPVKATEVLSYPDTDDIYYLYLSADSPIEFIGDHPEEVRQQQVSLGFEATLSREASKVALAVSEIEKTSDILKGPYDRYLPSCREELENENTVALLDFFDAQFGRVERGIFLPIESGPAWATWIDVAEYRDGQMFMSVHYRRVEDGEVLRITGYNSGYPDLTTGELMSRWESLVKKYEKASLGNVK